MGAPRVWRDLHAWAVHFLYDVCVIAFCDVDTVATNVVVARTQCVRMVRFAAGVFMSRRRVRRVFGITPGPYEAVHRLH